MKIAEKNVGRIPQYRTILGQGGGTFGHGSLAKAQLPTSERNNTTQMNIGSSA